MNKDKKIMRIPVEKIIIGDENFEIKNKILLDKFKNKVQKEGIKRPFIVTKMSDKYVLYNGFYTFTAAKIVGYKTLPCIVINNVFMERKREYLEYYRRNFVRNRR